MFQWFVLFRVFFFFFFFFFFFCGAKKETYKQFKYPSALWIIHVTHVHVCGATLLLNAKTLFLGQVKCNLLKGKSEQPYQFFTFSCKSAQKKLSHRGCVLTGMISSWNFPKKPNHKQPMSFSVRDCWRSVFFSHLLNYVCKYWRYSLVQCPSKNITNLASILCVNPVFKPTIWCSNIVLQLPDFKTSSNWGIIYQSKLGISLKSL